VGIDIARIHSVGHDANTFHSHEVRLFAVAAVYAEGI
jgi:hypothetical protein